MTVYDAQQALVISALKRPPTHTNTSLRPLWLHKEKTISGLELQAWGLIILVNVSFCQTLSICDAGAEVFTAS